MSIYAIGDVQGCYEPLQRLLAAVDFAPGRDQLWFVGDLVNRGPASLATLRFIKGLGEHAVAVLGNHDLHLLARAHGGRAGRRDTLEDVLAADDSVALMHWLRHRPLLHEGGGWAMCHAGIAPAFSLPVARKAARQAEAALQGSGHRAFLAEMYGDEPRVWTPALRGRRRLRYAINAFTRLRYVADDGSLDFRQKSAPEAAPPHLKPWFAANPRESLDGTEVVFGHWSTLGRIHWPEHGVWGLDTGAVWGGRLTALELGSRTLTQVECPEYRRPDLHGEAD